MGANVVQSGEPVEEAGFMNLQVTSEGFKSEKKK